MNLLLSTFLHAFWWIDTFILVHLTSKIWLSIGIDICSDTAKPFSKMHVVIFTSTSVVWTFRILKNLRGTCHCLFKFGCSGWCAQWHFTAFRLHLSDDWWDGAHFHVFMRHLCILFSKMPVYVSMFSFFVPTFPLFLLDDVYGIQDSPERQNTHTHTRACVHVHVHIKRFMLRSWLVWL